VVSGELLLGLPLAILAAGAVVAYLMARLAGARGSVLAAFTALVFVLALLPLAAIRTGPVPQSSWALLSVGSVLLLGDPGALIVGSVALGLGSVVALYSGRYIADDDRAKLYYPLLTMLVAGLIGMVMAGDLFSLYLFCELMSISAYALVAFRREEGMAIEAGFKYLIVGSLGTALLLFGISFIYRASGSLLLVSAPASLAGRTWARAGIACVLVGLGVKGALVPLHTWLPDAHGRAPSSVSAMLSGIVVPSALYALLKIGIALGFRAADVGLLLIGLSLLNMTLGNLMALAQTDVKRLLAYSTVAQVGYVMFGVGIGLRYAAPGAIQAAFYLLLAHAALKGLAFMCTGARPGATTVASWRGTAQQFPMVATALTVSLGGLAGVPPLAGFVGKWLILVRSLRQLDLLAVLATLAFLANGLLALGYYLPLIGAAFRRSTAPETIGDARPPLGIGLPLTGLCGLVLAMGVHPAPWLEWISAVGPALLAWGH
jgi:proton-translocating NADH-quinone oxidoreductase chain N